VIPKRAKGICSTVLLLLITILALASIPLATSQQFTTSTITTYQTSVLGISQSTTVHPLQRDLFQRFAGLYIFVGNRVGESVPSSLYGDIHELTIPTNEYPQSVCYGLAASFNATNGDTLSGSIGPANVPVGFFVMDNESVWSMAHSIVGTTDCPNTPADLSGFHLSDLLVSQFLQVGHYDFIATIPHTGEWWIGILVNGNTVRGMSLSTIQWSWSATLTPLPYETTSVAQTTQTNQVTLLNTQSLSLVQTQEVPFTQSYGGWIAAAIIGVLVIAVLFFALRKRTTHIPKQATLTQFVNAPTSCIKCGAELPPASEFCNKCGTKQT